MQKTTSMNNMFFQLMSLEYKVKAFFLPPQKILLKTDIKKDDKILDYGCGPGRYTIPAAKITGEKGRVFAVDIHPLALKKVINAAAKNNLKNIITLFADEMKKIEENSIDAVILFDTLHDIEDKENVLKNINRILRPGGILVFKDHHLKRAEIELLISKNTSLIFDKDKKEILEFKKIVKRKGK